MSLYSSREPFNDDPYPNVWAGHSERDQMRTDTDMFRKGAPSYLGYEGNYVVRPRPGYNRPQNNPTNRVLNHIRKNWPGHTQETKGHLISIHLNLLKFARESHKGEGWERFTEETVSMMDHARKVLTRLAALEKEES